MYKRQNLTTRRYTAAEVEALMNDDQYITLYGRLVDKFGDNGIVTALIAHKTAPGEADICLLYTSLLWPAAYPTPAWTDRV